MIGPSTDRAFKKQNIISFTREIIFHIFRIGLILNQDNFFLQLSGRMRGGGKEGKGGRENEYNYYN